MFIVSNQLVDSGFSVEIQELVYGFEKPLTWGYSDLAVRIVEKPIGILNDNVKEAFYFSADVSAEHPIYAKIVEHLIPILNQHGIRIGDRYRFKSNIFTKQNETYRGGHHTIHVDDPSGAFLSFLYYVEDSDGETVFFNETYSDTMTKDRLSEKIRVTPKRGRYVIFDSNMYHASASPVDSPRRSVLNFVFEVE